MNREIPGTDPVRAAADLRNQLNQMAAASQVLELSAESEKARSYLAMMNQSICRMLRIVGRMELSHRLSGNGITATLKHQDLTPVLESFASRLQGVLGDIGITFSLQCPAILPISVDFELLQQMLLELVSHFALAGTELSLTVAKKDQQVCLTLSDRGPGAADGRTALPSQLEEQEEQSSLELARRLAEVQGGTLIISSDANQSLTAAVSLPVGESAPGNLESPRTIWRSGGFDSVLVALSSLLPSRSFLPDHLG